MKIRQRRDLFCHLRISTKIKNKITNTDGKKRTHTQQSTMIRVPDWKVILFNARNSKTNKSNKCKKLPRTALCDPTKIEASARSEVRRLSTLARRSHSPLLLPAGWRSIHRRSALGSTRRTAAHAAPHGQPRSYKLVPPRKGKKRKKRKRKHLHHGPARVAFTDNRRAPHTKRNATC